MAVSDLPWRDMKTAPHDGSIFAVCYHPWDKPENDRRIQLAQWLDLYGAEGKLCAPWNYDQGVYAEGWMTLVELAACHKQPA